MSRRRWIAICTVLMLLPACGRKAPSAPDVSPPVSAAQEGLASWYGTGFHGRITASGERYNMNAMTAAHKTLPFNTRVRVVNLDNHRSTVVRINDRGPFVRGRIIDLSRQAAKKLDMIRSGVAPVRLYILRSDDSSRSATPVAGLFAVQVGAFRAKRNADRLKHKLEKHYDHVTIDEVRRSGATIHRVRVGRFASRKSARNLARRLRNEADIDRPMVVEIGS